MDIKEIEQCSANDEEFEYIRKFLRNFRWFDLKYKQYLTVNSELCALGNLILRGTGIVLPSGLRDRVLKLGHEGHSGMIIMKQQLT